MTLAVGWEKLDVLPKRLLALLGFSTHGFMGYVDGRSPRAGAEGRRERLLGIGREEGKREVREGGGLEEEEKGRMEVEEEGKMSERSKL